MIQPAPPKIFKQPESKPVDGKDGSTPYIGDNGNWFIKSEDTGAKAEPRDGEDGENAPRYRGAVTTPDLNNTGKIGDIAFNHLDYVIFTGASGWEYAFIYQWNAVDKKWEKLPREKNWEKYLDAVSDLTEGKADGVFRDVFLKNMFAQTLNGGYANILHELRVGPDDDSVIIDGRDRSVRSEDFVSKNDPQGRPAKGWIIRGNGDVEFNDGIFRGHLDGATGTFSGDLVAAGGTFKGNLQAAGGTFQGTLEANIIKLNGVLTEGDNFTIVKDNSGTGLYYDTTWKVFKTLKVVGTGSCRIKFNYTGRIWISILRGTEWENVTTPGILTSQSYVLQESFVDVVLNEKVNIIRLEGSLYDWSGGSAGNQYFNNTRFEAWSQNDPGLFAYMSSVG